MKRLVVCPNRFHGGIRAVGLAVLLLLLIGVSPVAADGIIIPHPPPDHPIRWREVPLTVKYHQVDVTIRDQVATTHVDQVFVNEARFEVEGTYVFPLPEDAAISSFDMWVDGRKLEGRLLDKGEARRIYEEIVRQQRDPALLEYAGRSAFQASIFPIPPGGERRIELTYTQVLRQADGLVHYRYPLNTEKFSARPLSRVAVTVHLEDSSPLRAIYSPSHPVDVKRDGDRRATVSYEAAHVLPSVDFDLYYSVSAGTVAADLLSYKPFDEDGFFLLLLTPPVTAPEETLVARDVLLVLDTSGSMDGEKLSQAKAAAGYVLDHLRAEDRYNIVSFGSATRVFAERPVPGSRRSEGHEFIKRLTAQGSTDINRALLEALSGVAPDRPTVLIFLTDGLPTMGETNPDRVVSNVSKAAPKSVRLFAFGVGYDVDAVLLDQLSSGLRGTSTYVRPGQRLDEELSAFYARINVPVLVDVALQFTGVRIEDVYPYPLPDLFAGSQLTVVGRYREGGSANLVVAGTVNGQAKSFTYAGLNFAARGGDEFIARLWAQRKIGYLLAQVRLGGPQDELVKEIIALSTRYGVITPYTSFLVQEPQLALTQVGRDQLSRDLQRSPAPGSDVGGGAMPLAPQQRVGEAAVERAATEQTLKAADAPMQAAVPQVRQVGAKTFVLQGDLWLDTAFDPGQMQAEPILFGSEQYFQVLAQHDEIGRYLALGERVVVVMGGRAYAIGGAGQAAPLPTAEATPPAGSGRPTAPPQPTPAALTPGPNPVPGVDARPPASSPGVPGAAPGNAGPGLPPLCPGAVLMGSLGLGLAGWLGSCGWPARK